MANRIHDALDYIHADTQLIEATKQHLTDERMKKAQPVFHNRTFQAWLTAACTALFLLIGISGYTWIQSPVSYVSIDVNPSIELALNRFDRVVSATAFNAAGEEILNHLSLKGKKYTDAIDAIVSDKIMSTYLTDESELVFTVASNSHHKELKTGVENCSSHISHATHNVSADVELVSQAHDNGLSVGKYYAWLQLVQYDDSITIDECRNMSMSSIHHILDEQDCSHPDAAVEDSTESGTEDAPVPSEHGCCHDETSHSCN